VFALSWREELGVQLLLTSRIVEAPPLFTLPFVEVMYMWPCFYFMLVQILIYRYKLNNNIICTPATFDNPIMACF
jgi:hypothetical protein